MKNPIIRVNFFVSLFFYSLFSQQLFATENNSDSENEENKSHYFDCPCPHLIAHRGASGSYPDSSLLAFEKALEFHTDILELDVHLSKDRKIIVSHDDSLLRISGLDWKISEEKLNKLKKADIGATFQSSDGAFPYKNSGLQVLTFHELVTAFPQARFNIELKPNDAQLATTLRKYILKKNLGDRVVVASKHALALETYRKTDQPASMTSAHLNDIVWAYIYWFFNKDLKDTPYELLQLPYQYVNKSLVDYFHKHNKKVHVWTVNDTADIRRMLSIGVDGVMTDHPELAYPIFVELGLR